jgi:hypothetical protein
MSLFNLALDKLPVLEPVEGTRGGGGVFSIENFLEPTMPRDDGRQRESRELVDSEQCEIGDGGRTGTLEVSVVLPKRKRRVFVIIGFRGGCKKEGGGIGSLIVEELSSGLPSVEKDIFSS